MSLAEQEQGLFLATFWLFVASVAFVA